MSGVLAAINEYSSKALQDNGAALRQIDFGERRLYLRASPLYLIAAKCSGTAAASVESTLDDAFLTAIEDLQKSQRIAEGLGGARSAPRSISLQDLYGDLEKRISKRHAELAGRGVSPAKVLAWGSGLALVAWLSWSAYASYLADQVRDAAARVIAANSDVASYPISISVGHLGRSVTVEGLTPTDEARAAVITKLGEALPKAEIRDRLRALPNDIAVMEPKVESVRQEVADIQPEIAIVRESVSALEPQIATVNREVSTLEAESIRRGVQSALDRGARRLDEVRAELARIEAADGSSATLSTAAAVAVKGREEIEALRKDTVTADAKGIAANAMQNSVSLAGQLRQAGTALSQLLSANTSLTNATSGAEASTIDAVAASEVLADEAERLARIAVAVSQVLAYKRNLPPPPGPSARDRLESWTRAHAIFFGEDTNYRNEASVAKALDELAALMRETAVLVRVVGYTDVKGGNERNSPLSEARADKVVAALIGRGVPAVRLAVVGRKDNQDLSRMVGETSPNRRVEFEVGFEGEVIE